MIPKGYKHTELGILPRHWEVVRLGDIGKIIGGGTPDTKNLKYWTQKNGIVWLTPTEIKTKYIMKSERQITEKGLEESSAKKLPIHTILITTRATIGDIGIAKVDCTTNQGFQSLVCSNSLNYEFAYYVLQTYQIKKYFIRFACGSTFLELSSREVRKTKIPLPPLAEQEKIAEILSTWDTQIQNLCSLIKDKQTLKKGLCQILLTAKTRFKGFDKDWEVVRLGEVAKDEDFKRIPVSSTEREKLVKDSKVIYPYYGAMGQVGWINDYIFDEERVLLAEDGCPFLEKERQKSFIAKGKYWVNNHAHILKIDLTKGNNYFLCSQLNRVNYGQYINGSTRLKLNKEVMTEIKISLPPLAEQEKIAEVLSEADNEIKLLEQKLESLKSQKKGLMQKLLNGKVRIK